MNGNDKDVDDLAWIIKGFLWVGALALACVVAAVWFKVYSEKERTALEATALTAWKSAGCPVYKSSCGSSRHPYSCERKAAAVGRNAVGDIFVEAYAICGGVK